MPASSRRTYAVNDDVGLMATQLDHAQPGAVLQKLLAQVDAHYEVWDAIIVILPGKK